MANLRSCLVHIVLIVSEILIIVVSCCKVKSRLDFFEICDEKGFSRDELAKVTSTPGRNYQRS